MSEKLTLKYPYTFDAIRSCHEWNTQSAMILSTLQKRTRHYWPESCVNSDVFRARFPDKQLMLRMAKLATKRRIQYWHPWHMEVTHTTYSLDKEIDWFTPPTGDHEWIDSLVRFNHMIDLAAAYQFTHRKKYIHSFEYYLHSFFETRNKQGRHWKFLVNAAVRVINLVRGYDLISRVSALPLSVHLAFFENIIIDVRFLLKSLNEAVGNGAFFAATALLITSDYLGDIFYVEEWQTLSEKKLYKIINTEIQSDFMEVEQAPMYHGQVILTLLDYCIVLIANNRTVNATLKDTINGMLDTLSGLCDPEGMIPTIGDSDRFSISYIIGFYNAIFKTDYNKTPGNVTTSNVGKNCELTTFKSTGWSVVRWNYDLDTKGYLLFDCSGKPKLGSHSHADDLQFLLHTTNGPAFVDPGRFTYCTDFKAYFPFTRKRIYPKGRFHHLYSLLFPEFIGLQARNWKEYFKQTLSHNTISLDGKNQPGYAHRMDDRSETVLLQQKKIGPLVLLQGYCDTSGRKGSNKEHERSSQTEYLHQRTILGFLPNFWIIVDQVKTEQKYNWISSYHLNTGSKVSLKDDHLLLETNGDNHSMHFLSSTDVKHTLSIENDWVSPIYNKKFPSKTIRATIHKASEAQLVTLIHSHTRDVIQINETNTFKVPTGNGNLTEDIFCFQLTIGNSVTRLIINPGRKALKYSGLEFNAMIIMESRVGNHLRKAGFLDGTFLYSDDYSLTCSAQEDGVFRSFARPE